MPMSLHNFYCVLNTSDTKWIPPQQHPPVPGVLPVSFFLGDIIMEACFCLFYQVHLALGTNPTSHFWLHLFLETRLSIRLFTAHDWHSSLSGAKIMVQKLKTG